MPRWPGLALTLGGGLMAGAALGGLALARQGLVGGNAAVFALAVLVGGLLFVGGLVYVAIRQLQVRRVLPPERYRGPSVFILLALGFVVGSVLSVPFTADALVLQTGEGTMSLLGSAVLLVAAQAGLLVIGYLFVYRPRALAALPSFPGRAASRAALAGLGWGVLAWIGSTLVLYLVSILLTALGQPPPVGPAERAIEMLDPWLVIVAIVIFAPIAEELFFRGIVFNAWLREAGRVAAYVGSAALFAAIHLSLVSLLPIFLLGLALAWVYERSGSLVAPMVMHATVNGISVAVALAVRFGIIDVPIR